MKKRKLIKAVSIALVALQLFYSTALAGFLYLPFSKSYSPVNYVDDSYSRSKGWKTYAGHTGTDYPGDGYNTPVYAAYDGTVVASRETENDGCGITYAQQLRDGNYVKIDHSVGSIKYRTEYWHLKRNGVVVGVGQKVKTGDLIAYISNSGHTIGSDCAKRPDLPYGAYYHLHFDVKKWNGSKWVVMNPYGPTWLWATNPPTPATQAPSSACTYSVGQDSSRQQTFQQAYERNGGRNALGCPSGPTYWWAGLIRQDFSSAAILHNEGADNPIYSVPAYVVKGAIWNLYKTNPGKFGKPKSDEFINSFDRPQSNFQAMFIFVNSSGSAVPVLYSSWFLIDTAGTAKISFSDAESGGVQLIVDGQGTTGGWSSGSGAWISEDIPDIPVTSQLKVFWEQYDKIHSLHFGLLVKGADNADRLLVYSANAYNWWGGSGNGWVPVRDPNPNGIYPAVYNTWESFARSVFDDYFAEYAVSPTLIKEIRVGHFVHNSWIGDKGGTVKNIAFDEEPPVTEIEITPDFPDGGEGWYLSYPLVTLTATDDASGVDRVEYNLGAGWQTYAGPFFIEQEGEVTLQYQSWDRAGRVEPVKSFDFKIDTITPQTQLETSGPNFQDEEERVYVSAHTEFELNATDESSGVYETVYADGGPVEEGEAQTYSEPFSLQGDDGKHTVSYQSDDAAGNVEDLNSQEFYLDTSPPVSVDDSDGEWHNSDVTVTVAAQDPAAPDETPGSGVQKIDYGGTQEGEVLGDQAQVTFSEEGVHELNYQATDNVGNQEEEQTAAPVKIDKTPPEITGAPTTDPNENDWYNQDVSVRFAATDQEYLSGVKSVTPEVTVSTEGADQEVSGTAEDNAGNIAETTVSGINIDKTGPESFLDPLDPYYNNDLSEEPIELTYSSLDNLSGLDRARLYKRWEGEESWDFHYSAGLDGEVESSGTFNVRTLNVGGELKEGRWDFSSCAADRAGNEECNSSTIEEVNGVQASTIYDITPPSSSINSVEEGKYYNVNSWPGIFGMANDLNQDNPTIETSGVDRVEVQVDQNSMEGEWVVAEGVEEWEFDTELEDGFYTVYSRATDRAGNQEHTFQVSFVYDNTAPATSTNLSGLLGLNGWYVSPLVLELLAADATAGVAQTFYRLEGFDPAVYNIPLEFTDGTYALEFWSVDKSGNEEDHQFLTFKVDTIVPVAPVSSAVGGSFFEGESVSVSLAAEDGTQIYYYFGEAEPILYSEPLIISIDTVLTAYSVDEAGNQSETVSWEFSFVPRPFFSSPQVLGAFAEVSDPPEPVGQSPVTEEGEVRGVGTQSPARESLDLLIYLVLLTGLGFILWIRRIFLR